MSLTIDQITELDGGIGPNAMMIRKGGTKVINGKMPSYVRKELMDAVKKGALGRLKKDGLKPEIFYHPDHKNGAKERQQREFEYNLSLLEGVFA